MDFKWYAGEIPNIKSVGKLLIRGIDSNDNGEFSLMEYESKEEFDEFPPEFYTHWLPFPTIPKGSIVELWRSHHGRSAWIDGNIPPPYKDTTYFTYTDYLNNLGPAEVWIDLYSSEDNNFIWAYANEHYGQIDTIYNWMLVPPIPGMTNKERGEIIF